MPALNEEPIGHCPECRSRQVIADSKTTPWHRDARGQSGKYLLFGLEGCAGIGLDAIDFETPALAGKKRAK